MGQAQSVIARCCDEDAMSEFPSAAGFPTTHWSRVLRAGNPTDREGRDALERLCRDYWYPPGPFPAGQQMPCRNHVWGKTLRKQGCGCNSRRLHLSIHNHNGYDGLRQS